MKDKQLIENKRGREMVQEMKEEQEYIIKPELPPKRRGFFGAVKPANGEDLAALAKYLQRILSSPLLCQETFIFDEFKLDDKIKEIFCGFAANKMEAWKSVANQPCILDPKKLLNQQLGDEYEFHTAYIVRRPLNDLKYGLLNFNHWALKFEGVVCIFYISLHEMYILITMYVYVYI